MRWFSRSSKERNLDRELQSHIDSEADELIASGMEPQQARKAARLALGNYTRTKEDTRESWGWSWLDRLAQDLQYAFRIFGRTPGSTAIMIVTLAFGIGANTAIFSVFDAVLLRPLPYQDADRLVVVWSQSVKNPAAPNFFNSYRDFEDFKADSHTLNHLTVATWANTGGILDRHSEARSVLRVPVSLGFFQLLGVAPRYGRIFESSDLNRGCTAILKHSFWLTLGGGTDVLGHQIRFNQQPCTVVGVMPPKFDFFPEQTSLWTLITPLDSLVRDPENASVGIFGRLRPEVSRSDAQRELQNLYRQQHRGDKLALERAPVVLPLKEQFAYLTGPNLQRSIAVLFAGVTFVLLIACLNVANLLLGRFQHRRRELAVRMALGSSQGRLIRQLLTESLLLSLASGLLGSGIAAAVVRWFHVLHPIQMPPGDRVVVDVRILAYTIAVAVLTAVLFGLLPAFSASRFDVNESLKAASRSASQNRRGQRLPRLLVAIEIAFSLVLLVGAGLLISSVTRYSSVPLGFNPNDLIKVPVQLPEWDYTTAEHRIQTYQDILNETERIAATRDVALANSLPLNYARFGANTLAVEGRHAPNEEQRDTAQILISPGYFRVMKIHVTQGRAFNSRDRAGTEPVAIVNEALVRKYFPHQNPIGAHIRFAAPPNSGAAPTQPWWTIVGMVGDEKEADFFQEMSWRHISYVFRPVAQDPPLSLSLLVRSGANFASVAPAIQAEIRARHPSIPVAEAQTMKFSFSRLLAYPRFRAALLGLFAAISLLLASVGLYSVLAQFVSQRTREIGIRVALGAQRRDVITLVLRQSMPLVVSGLAAGLLLAWVLSRYVASLLYGVSATDFLTFAGVSFLLLCITLVATYLPARRAATVEPSIALRDE